VLLADGTGGFSAPTTVPLQSANFSRVFALGDYNGDTHPDLAVVEITTNGRLLLLSGDGAGNFSVQQLIDLPGNPINFAVASGDVNGDGHLDLVANTGDVNQILVWLGNGAGTFAAPASFVAPFGYEVRLADFNGDHRPDVVVGTSQGVAVYLNGCGQPATNLVLSASDSPDPMDEGATLGYSSTVRNAGDTPAADVTLTQTLPGLGTAIGATSSQGTCTISGRVVTCSLGTLAPGVSADVQVTFRPSAGGSLTSVVGVGSERPDPSPGDNVVTLTTAVTAAGRQLVVTNTNNAGAGSLRQAILDSNADSDDRDTIVFNIPGSGVHTIVPLTALPVISQPVIIDGTTQPGFAGTPLIELNGNGLAGTGLTITGGSSIVRGLVVNRFGGAGILLQTNGGNVIAGNYIGIDTFATTSRGNGGHGVQIEAVAGNTVGGVDSAARNVISGNVGNGVSIGGTQASGNVVQGNLIGTNGSGTSAIGNQLDGILVSGASTTSIRGNVVSGNQGNGVTVSGGGSGNAILGNLIGSNVQITGPIGNRRDGIRIDGAAGTIVGGAGEPLRNTVGGNLQHGVALYGNATGTVIQGNTIGFRAPLTALGNALDGIQVNNASDTLIGGAAADQANSISENGRNGVVVITGVGNRILAGSIFNNTGLGIDLGNDGVTPNDAGDADTGPNNLQNFPVLSATTQGVQGTLNSRPNLVYVVQFFANQACDASGNGEGATFLGAVNVNTNADGQAIIPLFAASTGRVVTATATSASNDTSEFSACVTVPAVPPTADLALTLTDSADPVAFGAPFNYVITAQNLGPNSATGVVISDTLPAGVSATSALSPQGACNIAGQAVTCNIPVLAAVAAATVTIAVSGSASGTVTNNASVTAATLDPVPGNNSASAQTTIALASCSGVTFSGPTSYAGSPGLTAVVRLVDMNHDGYLDAVATHETDGVDVFLNDRGGHFAAPRFTSTITGPWVHVVADFNGDTHPDVITASDRTAPGNPITLRLLTNDGTGTLTLSPTFSIPFGGYLNAADLDGDGDRDLAIITTAGDLAVLRNNGLASFGAPEIILAGAGFFTFGDFNGDNRLDVVSALGTSGFAVILANASGGFLPPVIHAVAGGVYLMADPADLNADGRLDLVIEPGDDEEPSAGGSVVFGDGAGGFGAAVSFTDSFIYLPTLADVNGDGRRDLVAINSLGSFAVWIGNGGASFSPPVQFPNAIHDGPAVGDLNGDGRPEIVIGDANRSLNVFLNNCGAAPASLGVALSESADPVNEGDELAYTVTVTNQSGSAASGMRLTSVLTDGNADSEPASVPVVSLTSSAGGATLSTAGNTYTWMLPTLPANGSATFTFRFRPLNGGTLQFTTGISSDGTEASPADNTASETTTVAAASRTIAITSTADAGPGSLRQAILDSNADSGDRDTISFSIPGGGAKTIILTSPLPTATEPVVIDATTQPGFGTAPIVELNGNGVSGPGLRLSGGNSIVRGLAINRFNGFGIQIDTAGGNVVEGNYIGTDLAGSTARPNTSHGILVQSSNNRIGGLTAATRNVLSGNQGTGVVIQGTTATNNVVQGNYIGINAQGIAAVPNTLIQGGVFISSANGNTIGGNVAGAGNVVSGNTQHAVTIVGGSNNVIQGNFIGTNPTGATRMANGGFGVDIVNAQNTLVGGPGLARNVISGNNGGMQIRTNASGTQVQNNYIGVNAAGTAAIANNAAGILVQDAATSNTIGPGNVISGNSGSGINVTSASNIIRGNLIGVGANGAVAIANNTGVNVNAGGMTIGGTTEADRNVISGNLGFGVNLDDNATSAIVAGNYLGLNAAGTAAVGNALAGVQVRASSAVIGGVGAGARNVISGNNGNGVTLGAPVGGPASIGSLIAGNYIGTNAAGTAAVANLGSGVEVRNGQAVIGGTEPAARNVLSGNGAYGVRVINASSTGSVIVGNFIGTRADGSGALANGLSGVLFGDGASGNQLGSSLGIGNLISGNATNGVIILDGADGNLIMANRIGTDDLMTTAIPNGGDGIAIGGAGGTTIGGSVAEVRNVISGNGQHGVSIRGGNAAGNVLEGNFIGTNGSGMSAIPNHGNGVLIEGAPNNFIGLGTLGNVISGNGQNGVAVVGQAADVTFFARNLIGANALSTGAIGNALDGIRIDGAVNTIVGNDETWANTIGGNGQHGIGIYGGAASTLVLSNTIGTSAPLVDLGNGLDGIHIAAGSGTIIGNSGSPGLTVVSHNHRNGIAILSGTANQIQGSAIFANAGLGIDLGNDGVSPNDPADADAGPNNRQNFPILTGVVGGVTGTLNSTPGAVFLVQFYGNTACDASGNGEGQINLGSASVITDNGGNAPIPLFGVPAGQIVTATATNGTTNDTSEFSACVTPGSSNRAPTANAGADQSVNAGNVVQLNGAGSSDPDSNTLTYAWTFAARPSGSTATLSNPATATPTFVPDLPGLYTMRLIVNDGTVDSAPDDADIHTNGPPIANAGPDQTVPVGSTAQLDGSGSSDPEHSSLTYHWILNTRPSGSQATLSNPNIVNPVFVADRPGTYIAQLVVNDGLVNSASDIVAIHTANRAPIANAGTDITNVALTAEVSLNGTASADPDGDALTYSWAFVQRPSGSVASLVGAGTATPSFTIDRAGRYTVRLTVNDGQLPGTDDVDVITVNVAPVANAGPDQTVHERDLVHLNGSQSSDENGNDLSYRWSFISRPQGSLAQLSNASIVAPTFTADRAGVYTLQLIVNDTIVDGAPDTVAITSLSTDITLALVDTPLVGVGTHPALRVLMPFEAPTGGVVVSLASSDDRIATVTPATVTIAAGANEGRVTVNGLSVGTADLTATAPGYSDGVLSVSVTNNVLSVPAAVTVALGGTNSMPVSIPSPAPSGGLAVSLISSNSAAVEVLTPSITIPAGALAANATISGKAPGAATVVASAPSFASASAQATTTGNLNITVSSIQIRPGFPGTITVQLQSAGNPVAAPSPGVPVSFTAAAPGCAAIAAATIPTGLTSATSTVTYGGSATLPCTTNVVASSPGLTSDSLSVTVNPDPGIALFSLPTTVGAGLMDGTYTARLAEPNHGGVTMRITSSDPAVLLVSRNATTIGTAFIDIPVANGSTDGGYYIHGVEGARGTVTLTATAPGFTQAQSTVTVGEPGLLLGSVPGTTTSLSTDAPFYVALGVLNASGNFLAFQSLRAGAPNLTVTVSHTTPAVAQLVTTSGTGQTRTVTIAAGQSNSPTSVATGGVSFDPLAAGSTTVNATAPGFRAAAGVAVTVTSPAMSLFSLPTTVGAGLMDGTYTARLGASAHGGVTMRITSSDPAVLLVSRNATTVGTAFIDIPVANGSTDGGYYIHGVEGARGTVTLTATAPGFTQAQGTVTVAESGLQLGSLPATTTTLTVDSPFYVATGALNTSGNFVAFQPLRAGAANLTVTVSHTTPTVAQLVTSGGTGQTRTVTIAAGQSNSPTSVATGGVSFDPIGGGSTTVSATAPGFRAAPGVTVTVDAPTMSLFSLPTTVGAGLMDGTYTARLGATAHGGVTVRITSSNPAVLLVSRNATTVGTAFVDIPVANGSTDAGYYIHGVEGARGTVTLTATAPGFTQAQGTATVAESGLQLGGLPGTTTTLTPDTAFYVLLGALNSAGSFLAFQPLRAGAPSVTVTISHTNTDVAQLVTTGGTGQARTVIIAAGQGNSPTSVASGGVAFDPIAAGVTSVNATAPGFRAAVPNSMTISAPGISLFSMPAVIGAGLQDGAYTARLGATAHGGVMLRVTSNNPSILLVSRTPTDAGSAFVDIPIANGATDGQYYVQGVRDARGRTSITATAPGFTPQQGTVDVVAPALDIQALPASIGATSASVLFYVRIGTANSFGTGLAQAQTVAPGAALVVTLTNSNSGVAQLVTAAGGAQTRTVSIAAGASNSPLTLAAGGVQFDPLSGGETTVTASSPGVTTTDAGIITVTVGG
jgi:uncharacterized repeat protein (TIGR01451 family)